MPISVSRNQLEPGSGVPVPRALASQHGHLPNKNRPRHSTWMTGSSFRFSRSFSIYEKLLALDFHNAWPAYSFRMSSWAALFWALGFHDPWQVSTIRGKKSAMPGFQAPEPFLRVRREWTSRISGTGAASLSSDFQPATEPRNPSRPHSLLIWVLALLEGVLRSRYSREA